MHYKFVHLKKCEQTRDLLDTKLRVNIPKLPKVPSSTKYVI